MKTDAKTMAEIWQEIDNNENPEIETSAEYVGWVRFAGVVFNPEKYSYRIKPKTITLSNGVVIPKPLDEQNIDSGRDYYTPSPCKYMHDQKLSDELLEVKYPFVYHTQDEAIEASRALFGIE